jgi:hypothetical protein
MMNQDAVTRRALIRTASLTAFSSILLGGASESAPLNDSESAQLAAVRTFAEGWKENNPNKVVSPFADNCSVRWIAQKLDAPPFNGKADFLQHVQKALADTRIETNITDMFVLGPVVVNCRHQLFDSKQNGQREDLYIGIFYFEKGKIQEWIDYAVFDPQPRVKHPSGYDKFTQVKS